METILAVIGGVAGLIGLAISIRAERRAARAEKQGERAERRELWTGVIMAGHDLVTLNVTAESPKAPLTRLRASATELIDGLPEQEYPNLEDWMADELQRIALALDYALVTMEGKPYTVENALAAHKPVNQSVGSLISNLRHFRQTDASAQVNNEMRQLTQQARKDISTLSKAIGSKPENH